MKKLLLFILAGTLLTACNSIPNKSVFEELTTDELSSAIKQDPEFGDNYTAIRLVTELTSFSDVQKAQYKDVTYRRLNKYLKHSDDEEYWKSRKEAWGKEWDETLSKDLAKVDEKVEYWNDYLLKNSLSKYAKVELSRFIVTHYSYIGGVDDAYICFNITPMDSATIEQIKFTYSYGYKIDGGSNRITQNCIYSSPITGKKEGSWEIPYSEKDNFDGMTVDKFLQNYDLNITITDVRINGKNYTWEDLNIPDAIIKFWAEDTPETRDAVAALVNPDYVGREQYIANKVDEELKEYDELCFEFLQICKGGVADLKNALSE